ADAKVALLSYGLYRRRFGGDARIVGRKIQLNGTPYEVIGVMPPEYRFPTADFELWTPLYIPPEEIRAGLNYQYVSVARLKPGGTVAQAQANVTATMRTYAANRPFNERGMNVPEGLVEPLAESDARQVRSTLLALMAAVGCLLLIGCLNLGVLLIARSSGRAREMAV